MEVAAYPEFHPQARSAEDDLKNFVRKVEAGANSAITQYFFNVDSYFYFIDRLEKLGVTIPVVPGIMPIVNYANLVRFSDMCGAEIPRWIRKQLEAYGDDSESIRQFGTDMLTGMCQQLLDAGAPGCISTRSTRRHRAWRSSITWISAGRKRSNSDPSLATSRMLRGQAPRFICLLNTSPDRTSARLSIRPLHTPPCLTSRCQALILIV